MGSFSYEHINRIGTTRILMMLAAIGAVSWLLFLSPPLHSDDTGNMIISKSFDNITFYHMSHYTYRLSVIIPLFILNKLFGFGLAAYYTVPFIHYMIAICATYISTVVIFKDKRVGILACLLFLASFTLNTTSCLPMTDTPSVAFNLLAFALFGMSLQPPDETQGRRFLRLAAFCAFVAYLSKITAAVFLIGLPVLEFVSTRRLRLTFTFGRLMLMWLLAEAAFNLVIHGNAITPFKVLLATTLGQPNLPVMRSWSEFIFRIPVMLGAQLDVRLLGSIGLVGIALAVRRRNLAAMALTAGGFAVFAFNAYSVTSLNPLIPAVANVGRLYLLPVMVLTMAAAFVLIEVLDGATRHFNGIGRAAGLVACLAIVTLEYVEYYNIDTYYRFGSSLFIRGAHNDYLDSSRHFSDILATHPEVLNHKVFTLPERNFGLYPNYNRLDIVDAERFSRPDVPAYVLTRDFDLTYYADQFAGTGKPDVADLFLLLRRDTPSRSEIFRDGDIFMARMERWVTERETVFDLRDEPESATAAAWADGGTTLVQTCSSGDSCPAVETTICPRALAAPPGPATYQIDLSVMVPRETRLVMEVISAADHRVLSAYDFRAANYELGKGPATERLRRLREFRTATPTCLRIRGDAGVTSLTVESLRLARFKE